MSVDPSGGQVVPDWLNASGGFLAPMVFTVPERSETIRVHNPLRRWWFRRQGWSTEWVVVHPAYTFGQPAPRPVRESLPRFEARRGIANAFDIPLEAIAPPTKWERRRVALKQRWRSARERVAFAIAPELKPSDPWDDWDD